MIEAIRIWASVLVVAVLALISVGDVRAVEVWSRDLAINRGDGHQIGIQTVTDRAGGMFVLWVNADLGSFAVQRVGPGGKLYWKRPKDVSSVATDRTWPEMVADGSGGVIVTWLENHGHPACNRSFRLHCHVLVQRLDRNGNRLWGPNGVIALRQPAEGQNAFPQQGMWEASIASDGDGGAYVLVTREWDDPSSDLFVQHIGKAGRTSWSDWGRRISRGGRTGCNHFAHKASPDGRGGVVVVYWKECANQAETWYAQRISVGRGEHWKSGGVRLSSVMRHGSYWEQIGSDGGVIVYGNNFHRSTQETDMHIEKVSEEGKVEWYRRIGPSTIYDTHFSMTSDLKGGAFVTWATGPVEGGDTGPQPRNVFVQHVDRNGQIMWRDGGIPVGTDSQYRISPLIVNSGQGVIVAWTVLVGYGEPPITRDIFAQKLARSGTILWRREGIPVSTAPRDQGELWTSVYVLRQMGMAQDGKGGAFLAWPDSRNGEYDVYAQRIWGR